MPTESPPPDLPREIARALNERNPHAKRQIARVVAALGDAAARALLDETLQLEAGDGLLTLDHTRRRTPGGVFLYLARARVSAADRQKIWPQKKQRHQPQSHLHPTPAHEPPLTWSDRTTLYTQVAPTDSGEVRTVKVTLIGRPGKVIEQGELVLTTMKSTKVPALPKGLPTPPEKPTTYVVYLSAKHWRKVRDAIQQPDDALIVEGWQAFDPDLPGIAVWGTNVTTKCLQQEQRAARQAPD